MSALLYPLSYPNGGEAGSRTRTLAGQPMHHPISRFRQRGMCRCDELPRQNTPAGLDPLTCERLPSTTDS
jgi:hypothetical protein